jgi:hypothetical protein
MKSGLLRKKVIMAVSKMTLEAPATAGDERARPARPASLRAEATAAAGGRSPPARGSLFPELQVSVPMVSPSLPPCLPASRSRSLARCVRARCRPVCLSRPCARYTEPETRDLSRGADRTLPPPLAAGADHAVPQPVHPGVKMLGVLESPRDHRGVSQNG